MLQTRVRAVRSCDLRLVRRGAPSLSRWVWKWIQGGRRMKGRKQEHFVFCLREILRTQTLAGLIVRCHRARLYRPFATWKAQWAPMSFAPMTTYPEETRSLVERERAGRAAGATRWVPLRMTHTPECASA